MLQKKTFYQTTPHIEDKIFKNTGIIFVYW